MKSKNIMYVVAFVLLCSWIVYALANKKTSSSATFENKPQPTVTEVVRAPNFTADKAINASSSAQCKVCYQIADTEPKNECLQRFSCE